MRAELLKRWLVEKPQKRLLERSFVKWKRKDRLYQAHVAYYALVEAQRRYLLRKWITIAGLRKVAAAFKRWSEFVKQSALVLERLLAIHGDQQQRKAVMRWQRVVFTEKMDEEVAVRTWMRRHRRGVQALQRWIAKQQKLLLIAYWVHWTRWHRRRKCWIFNLQTTFRMRWIIANWRRTIGLRKLHRHHVRSIACQFVGGVIDQSCSRVQMIRHLERKSEAFRATMLKFQTFIATYNEQAQHKRLEVAWIEWRSYEKPELVKMAAAEARKMQTERRRMEWAARIASAHRTQTQHQRRLEVKKTVSHRPAWK